MTARTHIFAVVTVGCDCCGGRCRAAVACVSAYANRYKRGVSSAHFNLSEFIVVKNKLNDTVGRFGAAVAVACLGNNQAVSFGFFFELLIVICAFVGTVVDVEYNVIVHMHHFMDKACNDVFNRAVKCTIRINMTDLV